MSKYKVEMNGFQIQDCEKLSHQQTMQLLDDYHQSHDEKIKERLVLANLKLVLSLVQKYHQRVSNLDDLFQVGVIGLIKAIENFDTSLDVRFSTYAVPLIIGEIKRYIRDNSSMRIPRSMRDIAYKALMANEEFMKKNQREASTKELSKLLKIDEYLLVEALSSTNSVTSLSQEVQNDGNGQIDLESQIPDRKNQMEDMQNRIDLHSAMNHLDEKELQIILERYFLDHTQSEIAKELFISQAQVSRLEKQALSHLKKYMS
ncbi:MAG: sigma-70 family RNA polymerase sigma factor [Longibaculum muris]|uniref:RNA polymerase sigma factor n=1 Tax=Longibaculum muris TaxID=1796628 RepID=A0A4R3Z302_9FIRM|nr:sigma-70 family RNA polymerase sigma factor [Longibaculum muris]KXU51656.1 putative RNA polymerase sigma-G factor [Candidatus Stoquefichus sp. KLE1796]MBS5368192.1 sigma-70 family RNA polymerase sigma factor [Coprobacillus cateniformis]MCR1888457.1 sigma-70 family RNA polymerase sigma factor [Longibaculum muris]MED9813400.1 sigma-70 family RNA polymerase sigma factor [Longibaculum muris]TCV99331.1 RNA polymerase sporulation-specific sigma factor [Longibaculum muris]